MKKFLLIFSMLLLAIEVRGQTYFSDNFNDLNITDWTLYDADGDAMNWNAWDDTRGDYNTTPALLSLSYDFTPDNYIVSPAINLSSAPSAMLKYKVKVEDPLLENYSVYAATTNSVAAFLANGPLLTESVQSNGPIDNYYLKTIDLSAFAGQPQVYIAFRHHNSDFSFLMFIDDVSVTVAPSAAPDCPILSSPANMATDILYNPVTKLTWAASATGSIADSYDVYLDQNPNPSTLLANVITGTTYPVSGLLPFTTYYWKVVPKNTAGAATGCAIYSFETNETDYCSAGTTKPYFNIINNVTFADINNNSSSLLIEGYQDFTSVTGNVSLGQTYAFSASGSRPDFDSHELLVWIDFNNDFDFDDVGEKVMQTTPGFSPYVGNITIPATAVLGKVRMRVRLNNAHQDITNPSPNSTPCGNSTFGQVEDYTLNIGPLLSVSDSDKVQVRVFPNPVTDILNIESPSKVKSVSVFDASGKSISNYIFNAAKSQINFSGLVSGIYFLNVEMENMTKSIKVVKK